jgi:hypothetical protein
MIGFGLLLLIVGLPGAVYPYQVTRFFERLDAIGSETRLTEVEPADWNVLVTRIFSVGLSLVGVSIAGLSIAPKL